MAKKLDDRIIYVTSADGKPKHFLDPYHTMDEKPDVDDTVEVFDKNTKRMSKTTVRKHMESRGVNLSRERYPIDITVEMIKAGRPEVVFSSPFVQGLLKDGYLIEVDAPPKANPVQSKPGRAKSTQDVSVAHSD